MNESYILVEAYMGDLAYEVNARMKEGYVPQGGPFPGREGISSRKIVQAMYRPPENAPALPQQLDPTIEIPDPDPHKLRGLPGEKHAIMSEDGMLTFPNRHMFGVWMNECFGLNSILDQGREHFINLEADVAKSFLDIAQREFYTRVSRLRDKQREPYVMHQGLQTNAEVFDMIEKYMRATRGVVAEYQAACEARDPSRPDVRKAVIYEEDVNLLIALLENEGAQYPTKLQEVVSRLKRQIYSQE